MKYIIFLLMTAALTVCKAATGYPSASPEDNPVWYYIQVLGEGSRSGRVMTVTNGQDVYGRALLDTTDEDATGTQLWRVVQENNDYYFQNKATGRYLDVRYDTDRSIGIATLTDAADNAFRLYPHTNGNTGYFNLQSSRTPASGNASERYLHQANDGGQRDFVIMMVGSNYADSENSAFRFVAYEDPTIRFSDADTEHWYTIHSARESKTDVCVTDYSDDISDNYPFMLEAPATGNARQLWKLTRQDNGKVNFTNRATGQVIGTSSYPVTMYNVVQSAVSLNQTDGWTTTYLGQGQYAFSATEEDGIERFLNAATEGIEPEVYNKNKLPGSGFAWKLHLEETTATGIGQTTKEHLSIRVSGKRIVVENARRYEVYTLSGQKVNSDCVLSTGIYIVKAGRRVEKVLVP